MNWFGELIQKEITKNDSVLDLGCGIMQATTDVIEYRKTRNPFKNLRVIKCKSLLGCDMWRSYLDVAKKYFPVVQISMNELDRFVDESFDVVMCLDVLEHLELQEALNAIENMKRIARKKLIIYTPSNFKTNEEHVENVWNLGENRFQEHKSFLEPKLLKKLGFSISFPYPDKNTLGIFNKQDLEGTENGIQQMKLNNKNTTDRTYEYWKEAANGNLNKVMNKICDNYNKDDFNLNKDSIIFNLNIKFKKEDIVLDLACGIGRTCKWVAPKVARYIGIDFIPAMIDKARIFNKDYQNAEFFVNDGKTLSSWDIPIDIVYCELAFQHMLKPVQQSYVKEIYRVLKQNGRFYGQLPRLSYYKDETYSLSEEEAKELLKDFNVTWIQIHNKYPYPYYYFKAMKEIS